MTITFCPHCQRKFASVAAVDNHVPQCPMFLRDAVLSILADPASPGHAVRRAQYISDAGARGLPSVSAIDAAGGYAAYCNMFGLQVPVTLGVDIDAALDAVRRISSELQYPAGIACSRSDYERTMHVFVLRALLRKFGTWGNVAAQVGLRAESRAYYMSVAHARRVAMQNARERERRGRTRIFDYDDEEYVLNGDKQREVPGTRRIVKINADDTALIRYEVATVLR